MKKLVEKYGILSSLPLLNERLLLDENKNLVKPFCFREDNSRIMHGKKYFVSVKLNDGKRIQYR